MEQLIEIFPHIDKDAINFIFKRNNKDFNKTVEELIAVEPLKEEKDQKKEDLYFLKNLFQFEGDIIEKEYKDSKFNLERTMENLLSLQLLKDEENLKTTEKTYQKMTKEERENSKISELHKMFPQFSKEQVKIAFVASNKDVNATFESLELEIENMSTKKEKKKKVIPVIPVQSTLDQGEKNVFSKEILSGDVKKPEYTVVKSSHHSDNRTENSIRYSVNKSAEEYREEANELAKLRNKLFNMACEAFKRGDGRLAKEYSERGRQADKDMKESHEKAFLSLKSRNTDNYRNILDLHGFFETEAIRALEERLKTTSKVEVITGIGKHSSKGPVLRSAIEKYCREKHYRCKEVSDGILQVRKK